MLRNKQVNILSILFLLFSLDKFIHFKLQVAKELRNRYNYVRGSETFRRVFTVSNYNIRTYVVVYTFMAITHRAVVVVVQAQWEFHQKQGVSLIIQ